MRRRPVRFPSSGAPATTVALAACLLAALHGTVSSMSENGAPSPIHDGGWTRSAGTASPFRDATPRHHDGTERCAVCHQTFAAPSGGATPGSQTPLLRAPSALELCLGCHDGSTEAPDVVGLDSSGIGERSAGFFDAPGVVNPRGHDLGSVLETGATDLCARCHGGSPASMRVTCVDCHDPHGNGVARNLRWASGPGQTPDLGLFVDPAAAGMARYASSSVAYGTLDSDALREVSSICIDCHHVFSGSRHVDPDGNGTHSRHPSYDSERGSPNSILQGANDGGSAPAHWESGVGSGFGRTQRVPFVTAGATDFHAARVVDAARNGVFCLSCHQAHGSAHAFAMRWPVDGGTGTPGCDQCHRISAGGDRGGFAGR